MSFSTDDFIVKIALQVDDSQLKEAVKTADKLGSAMDRVNNVGPDRMTRPTASERESGVMGSAGQNQLSLLRFGDILNSGLSKLGLSIGGGLAALLAVESKILSQVSNTALRSQLKGASAYDLYLSGFVDRAISGESGAAESLAESNIFARAQKLSPFTMESFYQKRGELQYLGVTTKEYDKIIGEQDIRKSFAYLVDLVNEPGRFNKDQLRNLTPYFGEKALATAALTTPNEYRRAVFTQGQTIMTPAQFKQTEKEAQDVRSVWEMLKSGSSRQTVETLSPLLTTAGSLRKTSEQYATDKSSGRPNPLGRSLDSGIKDIIQGTLGVGFGANKGENLLLRYFIDSGFGETNLNKNGLKVDRLGNPLRDEKIKEVKVEKLDLTLNVDNISKGENKFLAEFGANNQATMATVVFTGA